MSRLQTVAFRPDLNSQLRFRKRFPLEDFNGEKTDMKKYLTGTHHISLKQVPSALTLRKGSSGSVGPCKPILLDAGFSLEQIYSTGESSFIRKVSGSEQEIPDPYRPAACIDDILSQDSFLQMSSDAGEPPEADGFTEVKRPGVSHRRIVYEDFFRIISGRFLSDFQGRETGPRVVIWYGDVMRLQDQIPANKFQWEKFGRKTPKNSIRFQDVKSHEVKADFLWNHTFWGRKLTELCREEKQYECGADLPPGVKVIPRTARTLKKTLIAFLKGEPDPRIPASKTANLYAPDRKVDRDVRSRRLLEMLKTVDGVFAQRFCAFPHEEWTYEKYDLFVLGLIWELITDEFLDGQLTADARKLTTRFSELKKARKTFKLFAGQSTMREVGSSILFKQARWLRRYFLPLYEE